MEPSEEVAKLEETLAKGADDSSETMPHADHEGVGIEGGKPATAPALANIDPLGPKKTKVSKAASLEAHIKSCVKACKMPMCVAACKAMGDPEKLDQVLKDAHKVHLQQTAQVAPPTMDAASFLKKCEDTCKVEACKQMCRTAGAKHMQEAETVFHYDPATTDEVTGKSKDAEDVELEMHR